MNVSKFYNLMQTVILSLFFILYRLSIDSAVNGSSGYDSGYSGRSSSSSSVVSNPDMQVRRKKKREMCTYFLLYIFTSHHADL